MAADVNAVDDDGFDLRATLYSRDRVSDMAKTPKNMRKMP
jgi:hypothetical protein